MISAPESNVVLTDEETRRIETVKTRVQNLETEVAIATKNLAAIKQEIVRATEEKTYTQETLDSLASELAAKAEELAGIKASLNAGREAVEDASKERVELLKDLEEKSEEFTARETLLAQNEESFAAKLQELRVAEKKNTADREQIEEVKKILTAAVASATWN